MAVGGGGGALDAVDDRWCAGLDQAGAERGVLCCELAEEGEHVQPRREGPVAAAGNGQSKSFECKATRSTHRPYATSF